MTVDDQFCLLDLDLGLELDLRLTLIELGLDTL